MRLAAYQVRSLDATRAGKLSMRRAKQAFELTVQVRGTFRGNRKP
jgi:hypothetical protein